MSKHLINLKKILDVYPNPVSDLANFQFVIGNNHSVDFYIIDCMGRIIVNQEIVANRGVNKFQLDLSNLANGLYSYNLKFR